MEHNKARLEDREQLLSYAVCLAYSTFDKPTDEHIIGVLRVLLWGERHGIAIDAITLH